MLKSLLVLFIFISVADLYAKTPKVIKLPPYCAEFTQVLAEKQKYLIEGDRNKPYGQCHGRSFVEIEPEELAQNVDQILERIDEKNKGKIFFQKEKVFEEEGLRFRNKLILAAIQNVNKEKQKFLGIYPNIKPNKILDVDNSKRCERLSKNNEDLAAEIQKDKELSNNKNAKLAKEKEITDEQKAFLKFHLQKALISNALYLSTEAFTKKRKKEIKKAVSLALKKHRGTQAYDKCLAEKEKFTSIVPQDKNIISSYSLCDREFRFTLRRQKEEVLADQLIPEKLSFTQGFQSSPLLYDDENNFNPLNWVNLKIKPSKVSEQLVKGIDRKKLIELGDILNRSGNPDFALKEFQEKNLDLFDFDKKLDDKSLHKKLKKSLQKRVTLLSDSAQGVCREKGESLHIFPSFVESVLSQNENKAKTIEDITGQCYLLQRFPKQEIKATKLTYVGVAAVIGGTALQFIPGPGTVGGAGLIAVGVGGALTTLDAALNKKLADKYDTYAAALKNTHYISYEDYLRDYKEKAQDAQNTLTVETAFLFADVGTIIRLKKTIIGTKLLNNNEISNFKKDIAKNLHETWRKKLPEGSIEIKEVPSSAFKPGETPAQALDRFRNEGFEGLSISETGELVQNINQKVDLIIPALNKLNSDLAEEYAEVIIKNIDIKNSKDIDEINSQIHDIWKSHNGAKEARAPEQFRDFHELTIEDKLKDLDVAELVLQRNPAGISNKTQKIIDSYRANLLDEQKTLDLTARRAQLDPIQRELFLESIPRTSRVTERSKGKKLGFLGIIYRPVKLSKFRENNPHIAEKFDKQRGLIRSALAKNLFSKDGKFDLYAENILGLYKQKDHPEFFKRVKEMQDPERLADYFEQLQAEAFTLAKKSKDKDALEKFSRGEVDFKYIEKILEHRAAKYKLEILKIKGRESDHLIKELDTSLIRKDKDVESKIEKIETGWDFKTPREPEAILKKREIEKDWNNAVQGNSVTPAQFKDATVQFRLLNFIKDNQVLRNTNLREYNKKLSDFAKAEKERDFTIAKESKKRRLLDDKHDKVTEELFFHYKEGALVLRDEYFAQSTHGTNPHAFQVDFLLKNTPPNKRNEVISSLNDRRLWNEYLDSQNLDVGAPSFPEYLNLHILRKLFPELK